MGAGCAGEGVFLGEGVDGVDLSTSLLVGDGFTPSSPRRLREGGFGGPFFLRYFSKVFSCAGVNSILVR